MQFFHKLRIWHFTFFNHFSKLGMKFFDRFLLLILLLCQILCPSFLNHCVNLWWTCWIWSALMTDKAVIIATVKVLHTVLTHHYLYVFIGFTFFDWLPVNFVWGSVVTIIDKHHFVLDFFVPFLFDWFIKVISSLYNLFPFYFKVKWVLITIIKFVDFVKKFRFYREYAISEPKNAFPSAKEKR